MNFFKRFSGSEKNSAQSAKERLQLVLTHDRTDMTPAQLEALKDELLEVISRHIEIDPDAVNIDIAREGRAQRLIADIPLKAKPRRRGR